METFESPALHTSGHKSIIAKKAIPGREICTRILQGKHKDGGRNQRATEIKGTQSWLLTIPFT